MDVDQIVEMLISYGINLLGALVFLLVGLKVSGMIAGAVEERMQRTEMEVLLQPFLVSLLRVSLQVLVVISVASMLGIAMTSFIVVLGAASFAVGLALQGSLANFAGGTLILLLKPFKVGDYIESAGYAGTVKEIQIFYTLLDTFDNNRVVVPNAVLSNSSTVNYSVNPIRRLDFALEVSYQDSIEKVKRTLHEVVNHQSKILEDPPHQVLLGDFSDSAVVFYLRVWCRNEDYWPLNFEMREQVKNAFDDEGITIPFPQREVHLVNQR